MTADAAVQIQFVDRLGATDVHSQINGTSEWAGEHVQAGSLAGKSAGSRGEEAGAVK